MDDKDLRNQILDVARKCYDQGPGWAQEMVVLREFAEQHHIGRNVEKQQDGLTCWHDLVRDGELSWGYNIDNPNAPWFHFPKRPNGTT